MRRRARRGVIVGRRVGDTTTRTLSSSLGSKADRTGSSSASGGIICIGGGLLVRDTQRERSCDAVLGLVRAAGDEREPILIFFFSDKHVDVEPHFAEKVVVTKGIIFVTILTIEKEKKNN